MCAPCHDHTPTYTQMELLYIISLHVVIERSMGQGSNTYMYIGGRW